MVLAKLQVPERPTNLDKSRARACCACRRRGWGLFGHFFSRVSFLVRLSRRLLWGGGGGGGAYRMGSLRRPSTLSNYFSLETTGPNVTKFHI